jgi:hypothetical protein
LVSLTCSSVQAVSQTDIPEKRREGNGKEIILKGAKGNNLKNVTLRVPLGKLIGVTGVSGSGKSSLINEIILYPTSRANHCVYFRCADPRRDGPQWYVHAAGDPVQTDSFWKHRFAGNIRTLWAGTDEHSLTNWFAHAKIWEHFDRLLLLPDGKDDDSSKDE